MSLDELGRRPPGTELVIIKAPASSDEVGDLLKRRDRENMGRGWVSQGGKENHGTCTSKEIASHTTGGRLS